MTIPQSILDILLVASLAAVAAVVIASDSSLTVARILSGLSLILFVPGYVLLAALYPEAKRRDGGSGLTSLTTLERIVVSIPLSVSIVALIAFAVEYTPYDIARMPVLVGVVGWVAVFALLGLVRRLRLPSEERFGIDFVGGFERVTGVFERQPNSLRTQRPFEPRTRTEVLLNVLVVGGVALLAVSVAFAAVTSPGDESFTELYFVTENEDGELVSEGFQTTYDGGDPIPVDVIIENHEGETTEYTTVILLQEVATDGTSSEVQTTVELGRAQTAVANDDVELVEHEVMPAMSGELRLTVLLYKGEVPDEPTIENADQSVYRWITVQG